MRRRRAVASAVGLAAVLAGCGDSSSDDETESSDPCAPENLIWIYARYLDSGPTYPTAVFRMRDGSETRLTDDDAATDAAVSPDGSRIAFARGSDGDPESAGYRRHRLYVAASNGSDERPLLDPAYDIPAGDAADTAWDRFPVWSPDGSSIAFVRNADFADPGETVHAVMVVPASGGEPQPMPGADSDIWDPAPAWSADGSRLAWVTATPDTLRWATREGREPGQVRLPGAAGAPAWTDGDRTIVVPYQLREYEPNAESGVYRVDLATGEYEKAPLDDGWLDDLWALPTGDLVGAETIRDDAGDGIGGRIVVLDAEQPSDRQEIASFDTELNGLVTAVPDDPDGWAACTRR